MGCGVPIPWTIILGADPTFLDVDTGVAHDARRLRRLEEGQTQR